MHTPKVLGYAFQRDATVPNLDPDQDTTGLQKYGLLGFILMEFPTDGALYQGPSDELPVQSSQQIEMSYLLAEVNPTRERERKKYSPRSFTSFCFYPLPPSLFIIKEVAV